VLNTLEHAGYVVRLGRGRFGLGPKVPELYRLFHRRHDLVPAVRPLLGELADRAEEDAYLAVFRDGEVVVAEVMGASRRLHVDGLEVGFTRIAHTTAIGKVLLASAPDDDLDDYLRERPLVPYTHRTLPNGREHDLERYELIHAFTKPKSMKSGISQDHPTQLRFVKLLKARANVSPNFLDLQIWPVMQELASAPQAASSHSSSARQIIDRTSFRD